MSDRRDFYMTKGLPASGKSTWARQYVLDRAAGKAVRVNQDLLRVMLHMDRFGGGKTERIVQAARHDLIELSMRMGCEVVISDDTNFHPDCEKDFRQLCEKHGYQFTVKDFTDVSVEECIKRDLKRDASVGEQVIRKMYRRYLAPVKTPFDVIADPNLPFAVMVDIDGTVAIMDGRGPYDPTLYHTDKPHWGIIDLVNQLSLAGDQIIFCSGRDDTYRDETKKWLQRFMQFEIKHLYMRPAQDKRKDAIVKKELYESNIKGKWNVRFVLDDRNQVVQMWRDEGLVCLQVADGNF